MNHTKGVWMGLAPPRDDLIVWFVLLQCLESKDNLWMLGCLEEMSGSDVLNR